MHGEMTAGRKALDQLLSFRGNDKKVAPGDDVSVLCNEIIAANAGGPYGSAVLKDVSTPTFISLSLPLWLCHKKITSANSLSLLASLPSRCSLYPYCNHHLDSTTK
jgi:hypothetical protein